MARSPAGREVPAGPAAAPAARPHGSRRRRAGARGGAASLLAFLPLGFLVVFGGIPILLSLGLMLGHLGGPNSAVSELGQGEIPGRGLGTLGAITQLFENHAYQQDIIATVVVFLVSAVIVLAIVVTITLWHRLRPSRPMAVLQFLAVIPLFIPVVIASFSLWTFWGSRGFTDSLAQLMGWSNALVLSGKLQGVVVAEVWVSLPFAILLMRAAVSSMGESSLDAARDAGAGPFTIGRRIMLPQLRRECTIVFCFTAVGVLGSFTVPYIVGPSSPLMLGVDAVDTFSSYNQPQQAAVIGFTIFVLAGLIGCLYALGSRQGGRRSRAARGATGASRVSAASRPAGALGAGAGGRVVTAALLSPGSDALGPRAAGAPALVPAPRPSRRVLQVASRLGQAVLFLAALFFIVVPLAWLVLQAFAGGFSFPSLVPTSFTLSWWHTVLATPGLLHSVVLSLETAPLVVALSSLICLPAAYAIGRFEFPGRRLVLLSIFSINAFPRISLYIAMIPMLFALNMMGTFIGVLVVQLIGTILFMTWIPATGFAVVPDALVDAARDAGASKFQVFRRVLLPLARPSIAVAAVLSFLAAFDEAQGTFLVGAPNVLTMPVRMYSLVLDEPVQFAAVFVLALSVPSVILLVLVRKHLFAGTGSALHLR